MHVHVYKCLRSFDRVKRMTTGLVKRFTEVSDSEPGLMASTPTPSDWKSK